MKKQEYQKEKKRIKMRGIGNRDEEVVPETKQKITSTLEKIGLNITQK